jgi:hypothetical protein
MNDEPLTISNLDEVLDLRIALPPAPPIESKLERLWRERDAAKTRAYRVEQDIYVVTNHHRRLQTAYSAAASEFERADRAYEHEALKAWRRDERRNLNAKRAR